MKHCQIDEQINNNLNLLQSLLKETILEDLGSDMSQKMDSILALAANEEHKDRLPHAELLDIMSQLSDTELLNLAKSFTQSLNLINTAEQLSVGEEGLEMKENPIRFLELCQDLKKRGCSRREIIQALETSSMDLVLTAHPTETNRRSFINNLNETSYCLAELERSDLPDYKRTQTIRRLRQLIVQYWFTDEVRKRRPTPVEEAKWGNDVIETSLWQAVPNFIRELNVQLDSELEGYQLPIDAKPIQFTAWMGGDRDGNPNVTAKLTQEVLYCNRRRAARLFLADIEVLVKELSMSTCTEEFRTYLGIADSAEPYRDLMKRLRADLKATATYFDELISGECPIAPKSLILSNDDLWVPLYECYKSLVACDMECIASDKLSDTLRRVKAFGVTLMKMDIRQESTRHAEAIAEILSVLGEGDYLSWSEERKQAFLIRELASRRPLIPNDWMPSDEVREVIDTCCVIAQTPQGVIPVYLISMTQQPSDILAVHLLLKECNCPYHLPVGPLFETLEDLNNAASVMRQLFNVSWYRGSIQNKQMVMIGYSDSAKDAGSLAAGWAQYCAQEELIKVCNEFGVQLTLFHGRGGTIGRGGGPAKTALFSQPPGSLQGGLRVTVQGEMIRFQFGQPSVALRTLDLYLEAILEANLLPPPVPSKEWRALMDELRDESCAIYQGMVRGNTDFISYYAQATPIEELSKLPIGSRPAKRRQSPTIDSLRAIPWIFSWSQSRLMLPAWLGAGESLQKVIDNGGADLLAEMYESWPFFRTRISMLEMVYAKTDSRVAELYDKYLVSEQYQYIGLELREKLSQDIKTILSISHGKTLMADVRGGVAKSIATRTSFTLPLNIIQVELLRRLRGLTEATQEQELAMMITISGIAAGIRNSG